MQIHGLQQASPINTVSRAAKPAAAVESAPAVKTPSADQLDLSSEAQNIIQSQSTAGSEGSAGIRTEKVAALRQAIADGSYDTPEKLSAALDRMLDTFA